MWRGDDDGESNERHHAGLAVRNLAPCPTNENQASVKENNRPENWSDKLRASEDRRRIAKPVLDVVRPVDHWNGQGKAQPKLVAEHRDRMSGMTIVTGWGDGTVTGVIGHVRMDLVRHRSLWLNSGYE